MSSKIPCRPTLTRACLLALAAQLPTALPAHATAIQVNARIVETTCALQVSGGAGGNADLGDWTYARTASNFQLYPETAGSSATAGASVTVSTDPACPAVGMSGLEISLPPPAVVTNANNYGASAADTLSGPPNWVLGGNSTVPTGFPVWVEVTALTATAVSFTCQPGAYGASNGWQRYTNGAWNYGASLWSLSDGNAGAPASSPGTYRKLAGAGTSVARYTYSADGTSSTSVWANTATLNAVSTHGCMAGTNRTAAGATGPIYQPAPGDLGKNTTWKFRFTGPRSIPLAAWPSPPPPGTQFSGTMTLTMTYL